MGEDFDQRKFTRSLFPYGIGFAIGLILMLTQAVTYWQYSYTQVNPRIDAVSPGIGNVLFSLVLFVFGCVIAFNSAYLAFYVVNESKY